MPWTNKTAAAATKEEEKEEKEEKEALISASMTMNKSR
jgi:hypothetical protein